jgi:hypothetical protein
MSPYACVYAFMVSQWACWVCLVEFVHVLLRVGTDMAIFEGGLDFVKQHFVRPLLPRDHIHLSYDHIHLSYDVNVHTCGTETDLAVKVETGLQDELAAMLDLNEGLDIVVLPPGMVLQQQSRRSIKTHSRHMATTMLHSNALAVDGMGLPA